MSNNKKPSPSEGDWVRVRFDDHVEGGDEVMEFWVCGRVAKKSRKALVVDSWAFVDPPSDREDNRDNMTTHVILRATVRELHILPTVDQSRDNADTE